MKDYNITVNFQNGSIDSNLMELVQNDYNSTTLHFKFDTTNRVVFKMLYPDSSTEYITQVENNAVKLGPGILSQDGTYQIELATYGTDDRLTAYATMEFYVRKELIDTDEPIEPDDRVPILDQLINDVNGLIEETENLDVDCIKADDVATITITKKDGTTKTVEINDGEKGDKGDTGATPNMTIGTVVTGSTSGATITGTPENPVLNLTLEKGDKGDQGIQGETGDSGVRVSNTEPTDPVVNVWIDTSDGVTLGIAESEAF